MSGKRFSGSDTVEPSDEAYPSGVSVARDVAVQDRSFRHVIQDGNDTQECLERLSVPVVFTRVYRDQLNIRESGAQHILIVADRDGYRVVI